MAKLGRISSCSASADFSCTASVGRVGADEQRRPGVQQLAGPAGITWRGRCGCRAATSASGRPPTPPAALAASMAISSARSELMLLAARLPGERQQQAQRDRRRPPAPLPAGQRRQRPGQRQRRAPATAAARRQFPGAGGWPCWPSPACRPAPARWSWCPGRGGEEVADHGAQRGVDGGRRDVAHPLPVLQQRLHLGQRRVGGGGRRRAVRPQRRQRPGDRRPLPHRLGRQRQRLGPRPRPPAGFWLVRGHRERPARVLDELVLGPHHRRQGEEVVAPGAARRQLADGAGHAPGAHVAHHAQRLARARPSRSRWRPRPAGWARRCSCRGSAPGT